MKARELIRLLEREGWVAVRSRGSHRTFKHPAVPELITIPPHSGDLKKGLQRAILKQARLDIDSE